MVKNKCRLWMAWNNHCFRLLNWSKQWIDSQNPDLDLDEEWDSVVANSQFLWEKFTGFPNLLTERVPEDEVEGAEEHEAEDWSSDN